MVLITPRPGLPLIRAARLGTARLQRAARKIARQAAPIGPAGAGCSEQGGQEVWERVPPAPAPRLLQDAALKAFQGSAPLGRTSYLGSGIGKAESLRRGEAEGGFYSVCNRLCLIWSSQPLFLSIFLKQSDQTRRN